jgi:hypothetical protein
VLVSRNPSVHAGFGDGYPEETVPETDPPPPSGLSPLPHGRHFRLDTAEKRRFEPDTTDGVATRSAE